MFVKNAWYCAGWEDEVSQGRDAIVPKKIANERVVLWRRPSGPVVAYEDRCPHRQAPLSLGRKEGDALRCMYHGLKFDSGSGKCIEVPGQATIPERACLRAFPVLVRNNWIWVWMGDPAKADEALIPHSIGPDNPDFNTKTSKMRVETNYRWEIANLADLSHITWVHPNTVGGSMQYTTAQPRHEVFARGVKTEFWVRNCEPAGAVRHLFPSEARFDICFQITHTIPCTWVVHYRVFTAGTKTEGESDGQLMLDTWSSQAVTPRDENSVDYYYAWGPSKTTDFPGASDMLIQATDIAFREDAVMLEGQHKRAREKPDFKGVDIAIDAGPGKMLWVLDKLLREESAERSRTREPA